jgi:Domain of unknown function (DUF5127)
MIRVDGTSYTWMGGMKPPPVNQTSFQYTSTKSIFVLDVAGVVEMTVTFLSPISPNNLKRQSLVFSYLHVDIKSKDGANHDVQLYADISAGENLPSLCGCKLIDLSFQNGYLEIVAQLLSGTMV